MAVQVPVRVGMCWPLVIKTGANGDGGWSVMECKDREEALRVMAAYPSAAMPCWARVNEPGCFGLPKVAP